MVICLAGQFYHGIEYEVSELRPGEVPEKPDATMYVKGQELNVTRYAACINPRLISVGESQHSMSVLK